MRVLLNINSLLPCSYSHIIKSSRHFRWYSTAKVFTAGSRNLFDSVNALKFHPQQQHVLKFMSTNSTNVGNTKKIIAESSAEKQQNEVSIYEGKYTRQIIRVKLFSLTTSAMGLLAQPVLWHKGLEVSGTGLGVLLCSVAGIFTFVTPVLLHFVTKKYVVDIKYNKETDQYTCITVSFFLFKSQTKFKVEDIEIPDIETMFTSMKIGPKKVPVFVDAASFTDTHHYARFMGYDKPLDFRLDVNEINQNTSASDKAKST